MTGPAEVGPSPPGVTILPLTVLQDPAPGGGTYSSHAPQTGANAYGLWLTLQDSETSMGGYGATWSLYRSTNGGASWSLYYRSSTYDGPPPSMHTDRYDQVWVMQPTFTGGSTSERAMVHLHRFLPMAPYNGQHDVMCSFEASKSAKHTSIYDPSVDAFYFMGQGGDFIVLDGGSGAITRRTQMFSAGGGSGMAYPHMALDGGRLYVGGTVAGDSAPATYRDCLAGYSDDTGNTVCDLAGNVRSFPIHFATGGGLSSMVPPSWINLDPWLMRFAPLPNGGGLIGMMASRFGHVTRAYSVPPSAAPGSLISDISSVGDANGTMLDGYGILVRDGPDLYAISGGTAPGVTGRVILVMRWTGSGWETVARTEAGAFTTDYAIAGMRRRTPGQPIVVTFTDQRDNAHRWNQRMMVMVFDP